MAACKSTTDRNTPERSSSGDERMPRAPRRQARRRRTIGQRADASAKPERMPGVTDAVICSAGASDCWRAWSSTRKHSRTLRISARPRLNDPENGRAHQNPFPTAGQVKFLRGAIPLEHVALLTHRRQLSRRLSMLLARRRRKRHCRRRGPKRRSPAREGRAWRGGIGAQHIR